MKSRQFKKEKRWSHRFWQHLQEQYNDDFYINLAYTTTTKALVRPQDQITLEWRACGLPLTRIANEWMQNNRFVHLDHCRVCYRKWVYETGGSDMY